jgi:hypothetical protein
VGLSLSVLGNGSQQQLLHRVQKMLNSAFCFVAHFVSKNAIFIEITHLNDQNSMQSFLKYIIFTHISPTVLIDETGQVKLVTASASSNSLSHMPVKKASHPEFCEMLSLIQTEAH